MPVYDDVLFDPPAPVAILTLRDPQSGRSVSGIAALIDSGADVTLIPQASVDVLGLKPSAEERYELLAFDGARSLARAVDLELHFLRRSFRGRFLVIDQPWGVLGRNVLNHMSLLLDGPGLAWLEQGPAAK